ncbi:MAG: hypothetical protein EGP87_07700 [Paraprevotella clara]|nr:hypothetical protein [Paraprevotella clara]
MCITAAKIAYFGVYTKFFFYFLSVVDDHRVTGIRDAITEQAYPFFTDTDLSLIVQVVSPTAGYACGIAAFFQLQGAGYIVGRITVGAGQIVADGQGSRATQFGDVGQADNKTGDTHLNGRVTGNGSGIDRSGVSAFVCEQETVAVAADGRINSQTVQGRVELRYSIDVFVHEIGRIVGVGVLYVLLAGREA